MTLTNTGSITATTGAVDISNQGSITTFNNLQGESGSNPVTFIKSLPTNYNVIVNDTDDYGQIEFSSFSGQANTILDFGVHTTLSNVEANTTYSSVLSGLSSSNITITLEKGHNSPSSLIGLTRYYWTLVNSSGSLWDLKIADDVNITTDTNTSVTSSVKPNVIL